MVLNHMDRKSTAPFLKWAGGKRWLIEKHPDIFKIKYNRYIEPFLGSGAVFFHLQPTKSLINDSNKDLVDTYSAIKNNWKKVYHYLTKHHSAHSKAHYYRVREGRSRSMYQRAADFIYLNRTCWNGLYRVNLNGTFNVPIGTKSNVITANDDFSAVADLLTNCVLECTDFERIVNQSRKGDLVFVDPPYTVMHNNNGFIKYNQGIFSWDDQLRLRLCIDKAVCRGSQIILTNAYHESLLKLYKNYRPIKLERPSVISGTNSSRKKVEEMLIVIAH
jgi:DNA adenine methylase